MKERPATTKDVTKATASFTEDIAEAIGIIAHAIAKHSANPDGLIDDLMLISEPDTGNSPPVALFFRRFHAVMKGGIEPTEH